MTNPSIYLLGLHESVYDDGYMITRVAGGWIYLKSTDNSLSPSITFVPFNNEFQVRN